MNKIDNKIFIMPRVNMPFFGAILNFKFNTQKVFIGQFNVIIKTNFLLNFRKSFLANLTLLLKQYFVKFWKKFR